MLRIQVFRALGVCLPSLRVVHLQLSVQDIHFLIKALGGDLKSNQLSFFNKKNSHCLPVSSSCHPARENVFLSVTPQVANGKAHSVTHTQLGERGETHALTFNYWKDTPVLDLCIQAGHPCHTYGGCPPGTQVGHRLDRSVQSITGARTRLVKHNI